jgi:membrane protease subunit (stomatin/prohibitin family)
MNDPPEKVKAVPAAPAAPAGEFKFCPQCGSKNAKESKFCTNCGYKFEMIPVENAAVEETPAPEADAAASEGQDPEV